MNSKASVFARALKTDPDAIRHTDPLRVKSPTFKTQLQEGQTYIQDFVYILSKSVSITLVFLSEAKFNFYFSQVNVIIPSSSFLFWCVCACGIRSYIILILSSHFLQNPSAPWTCHFNPHCKTLQKTINYWVNLIWCN